MCGHINDARYSSFVKLFPKSLMRPPFIVSVPLEAKRPKSMEETCLRLGQETILIFSTFQEKRCFAVFSPVFENPFGAILFEAGQLKYSLKILNALEGETFAVQFLGSQDVSVRENLSIK